MAKGKVLLVDNNRKDLRHWAKEIRAADYEVQEASSDAAARRFLVQGGFDLAVIDLHLQKGGSERAQEEGLEDDDSGLRIAEDFRSSLPIIILTGEPTEELRHRALRGQRKSPAFDFIEKWKGAPALLAAMHEAIRPKIFISHGHDDTLTAMVARFLEDEGAKPILLEQQPRAGHMILDAFERHSNVAFAIVLATPDDEGRLRGEDSLKPRARQNVIFELGFFFAKLGRNRVLVLYKPEGEPIEWPSNFHGVLYREMEWGGEWREELKRDLLAVGIDLG